MKLSKIIGAGVAVSSLMLLSACASSDTNEAGSGEASVPAEDMTEVVFMLDTSVLPKHSIFFTSAAKGFYEAEGLDVEIIPGTGSLNTSTGVGAGSADFGFADFGAMAGAVGQGAPVQQLLLIHAQSPFAVVTTADSGIKTWDDLKGKKVAGEPAGSVSVLFPIARELAGLDEDDVEVIPVDATAKVPGLISGQWDGTLSYYVSDPPVMEGLGVEPYSLKWADVGFEMYSNGIISNTDTIENDPELVERFVRATAEGVKWSCDNQEESANVMVEEVPEISYEAALAGTVAACDILWLPESLENGLGYMTEAGVENVLEIAQSYLSLESELVASDLFTNDFNPAVMQDSTIDAP